MLSRLNLPAFSTDNWTSNIRTFVKAHRDYRSMASWSGGHEISDLEYKDTSGAFTALLIENGHLPESWQNRTPKYHFEVKSTPQELGAPFYMSGQQHRKVRDKHSKLRNTWPRGTDWHACLPDESAVGHGRYSVYHLSGV